MNPEAIEGTYTEHGLWKDSTGATGSLSGSMTVQHNAGRLEFSYDDGTRQISEPVGEQIRPVDIHGSLGEGKLFLGELSLTLEYKPMLKAVSSSIPTPGLIQMEDSTAQVSSAKTTVLSGLKLKCGRVTAAYNMKLKRTKEPVTWLADATQAPEPLCRSTGC